MSRYNDYMRKQTEQGAVSKTVVLKAVIDTLEMELFPENFDFMYDSIADANDRRQGKNPMSQEYIDRMNTKRAALGVAPMTPDGMDGESDDAPSGREFCRQLAQKLFGG